MRAGMGRREKLIYWAHMTAVLYCACVVKMRPVCWLVSSCLCLFVNARKKPKAMEVITVEQTLRGCWAVISSNMLFFIHTLLFDYLSLKIHAVYLVILLLCVCVSAFLTVWWLICRHMLIVNRSSLLLQWIPNMVLWQWMAMFNQYNPLNWDGQRLLQG